MKSGEMFNCVFWFCLQMEDSFSGEARERGEVEISPEVPGRHPHCGQTWAA